MKQNKKQIEANLRNKIANQYKASVDVLRERIASLEKYNQELIQRATRAEQEKLEMRDKLQQYEDWNQRLQEFMDMSEEDRVKYVETLRAEQNLNETLNKFKRFAYLDKMFSMAFSV